MKIIGICGSPRRWNTEILIRGALKEVKEAGAETELILLRTKKIELCRGCMEICLGGECKIKDDMRDINRELIKADGFIIGSPTYFGLPSGLLKNFMDRTSPIYERLKHKPAVVIAVGMAESDFGGIELTAQALRTFCLWHEMVVVGGPLCVKAGKAGEVKKNKEALNKAKMLGKELMRFIKKKW